MKAHRWATVVQAPGKTDCFWTLRTVGRPQFSIRLPTFQLSTEHTRNGDRVFAEKVSEEGCWRALHVIRPVRHWPRRR